MADSSQSPGLSVLVVDDEPSTRATLVGCIDWAGLGFCRVEQARNGLEGLEMAARLQPDLLLCDIRMPKMNGDELALKVRSLLPDCSIVFLSGYSDRDYLKTAIKVHAAAYLDKPLNLEDICATVREVRQELEEFRALQEAAAREQPAIPAELSAGGNGSTLLDGRLARVRELMLEHYRDPDLSVEGLARQAGLSVPYLCASFKRQNGCTVKEWLTDLRITRAREALRRGSDKLAAIALAVGMRDVNYFSTLFKKMTGMTPRDYRQHYHD